MISTTHWKYCTRSMPGFRETGVTHDKCPNILCPHVHMHVKGPYVDVSRKSETAKKKLAKATETNGLAEIANNLLSPLYERMLNEQYV